MTVRFYNSTVKAVLWNIMSVTTAIVSWRYSLEEISMGERVIGLTATIVAVWSFGWAYDNMKKSYVAEVKYQADLKKTPDESPSVETDK